MADDPSDREDGGRAPPPERSARAAQILQAWTLVHGGLEAAILAADATHHEALACVARAVVLVGDVTVTVLARSRPS
jgi:hypothetical protein